MVKTEGVSEQERSSHVRRRSCNGGQEGPLREGGFEERAEGVRKGAIQKLRKNAAGRNRAPSAALPEGACRARRHRQPVWSFCKNPGERRAQLDQLEAVQKQPRLEGRTSKIRRRRKLRKEEEKEEEKRRRKHQGPKPQTGQAEFLVGGLPNQPWRRG